MTDRYTHTTIQERLKALSDHRRTIEKVWG